MNTSAWIWLQVTNFILELNVPLCHMRIIGKKEIRDR